MDQRTLEIVIKARNEARAVLQSVRGELAHLGQQAKTLGGSLSTVGSVARTAFGVFRSVLAPVLSLVSSLLGAVFSLARAIGNTLLSALHSLASVALTAAKVGVMGLVGAMALLAKQGIAVNVSLENTLLGLTTMLRSAAAAQAFMGQIRREATRSVFELTDLADMSKRLLAFGFAARDVIPMIRTLGDVSAGLGGGKEVLGRMIIAFGQMKAKGTVSGEEAMQLMEAGINVRKYLGVQPGEEIGKLKIPSDVGIARIMAGLTRDFGGMQRGMAATLTGRLSNIRDVLNEISSAVTKGLYGSLTRASGKLLEFLQNLEKTKAGKALLQALSEAFNWVGRAIEGLVAKLPQATQWLANLVQTERLERFRSLAERAFGAVGRWLFNIGAFLIHFWPSIWGTAEKVIVGSVKVIGGGIAAIVNVFRELAIAQNGQLGGWQALGEGMRIWASNSIKMLTVLAEGWANLGTAIAAALAAAALGAKQFAQAAVLLGIAQVGAALTRPRKSLGGQSILRHQGMAAANEIGALDFTAIAKKMQDLAGQEGVMGAAARGYLGWGRSVDAAIAAMRGVPAMPGPYGTAGVPGAAAPGTAAGAGGWPGVTPYQAPWVTALRQRGVSPVIIQFAISGDWKNVPERVRELIKEVMRQQEALAYGG